MQLIIPRLSEHLDPHAFMGSVVLGIAGSGCISDKVAPHGRGPCCGPLRLHACMERPGRRWGLGLLGVGGHSHRQPDRREMERYSCLILRDLMKSVQRITFENLVTLCESHWRCKLDLCLSTSSSSYYCITPVGTSVRTLIKRIKPQRL